MGNSWQRLRKLIVGTTWIAAGSVVGQAVVLLATPFLARVYGPENLGIYATFSAVSSVLVAICTLRYEVLIPRMNDTDVAAAALFCVCAAVMLALAGATALEAGGADLLSRWIRLGDAVYLLPLVILLGGIVQTASYLSIRAGALHANGMQRLFNPIIFVVVALLLPTVGLPFAHVTGFLSGLILLWMYRAQIGHSIIASVRFARENWHTSARLLPAVLMDACAIAIPVAVINYAYGASTAGEYSQVQRLVVGPLLLLSVAVSHALHSEGARLVRQGAPLRLLLRDIALVLSAIAAIWFVLVAMLGSPVVALALGNKWRSDGAFVLLVLSGSLLRCIISPLSTLLLTLQRYGVLFCWQSILFVWVVGGLPVLAQRLTLDVFLLVFAVVESAFYTSYLLIVRAEVQRYDAGNHANDTGSLPRVTG